MVTGPAHIRKSLKLNFFWCEKKISTHVGAEKSCKWTKTSRNGKIKEKKKKGEKNTAANKKFTFHGDEAEGEYKVTTVQDDQ